MCDNPKDLISNGLNPFFEVKKISVSTYDTENLKYKLVKKKYDRPH